MENEDPYSGDTFFFRYDREEGMTFDTFNYAPLRHQQGRINDLLDDMGIDPIDELDTEEEYQLE